MPAFNIPCLSKLDDLIGSAAGLDIRIRPTINEKILESKPGSTTKKTPLNRTSQISTTNGFANSNSKTVRFREGGDLIQRIGRRGRGRGRGMRFRSDIRQPQRPTRQTKIKLPITRHNQNEGNPRDYNESDSDYVDKPGTCHSRQSVKRITRDNWINERTAMLSKISVMIRMSLHDNKEITRVSRLALYTPEEVAEQLGVEWKTPEDLCKPFDVVIVKSDEIKS